MIGGVAVPNRAGHDEILMYSASGRTRHNIPEYCRSFQQLWI
jgi:hypothetical protein